MTVSSLEFLMRQSGNSDCDMKQHDDAKIQITSQSNRNVNIQNEFFLILDRLGSKTTLLPGFCLPLVCLEFVHSDILSHGMAIWHKFTHINLRHNNGDMKTGLLRFSNG